LFRKSLGVLNHNRFIAKLWQSYHSTGLDRPLGLLEVDAFRISIKSAYEGGKVVSRRHRPPLSTGDIPGNHFCSKLSLPQGHSGAGRINSFKNLNYPIRNRTLDLLSCSAVPKPTALSCGKISSNYKWVHTKISLTFDKWNLNQ
jgi:hypothetical protein